MIQTINYNNKVYPKIEAEGNAAQYAIPFAKKFCHGVGYDIGCNKMEWLYPGDGYSRMAVPVDPVIDSRWDAYHLPPLSENVHGWLSPDYIFSSHCLEHLLDWVRALDYWTSELRLGGVLFLYLPHYSQEYWRPWNDKRHRHIFTPEIIRDYMINRGYTNIFVSGIDLNNSFMAMCEK